MNWLHFYRKSSLETQRLEKVAYGGFPQSRSRTSHESLQLELRDSIIDRSNCYGEPLRLPAAWHRHHCVDVICEHRRHACMIVLPAVALLKSLGNGTASIFGLLRSEITSCVDTQCASRESIRQCPAPRRHLRPQRDWLLLSPGDSPCKWRWSLGV